MTNLGNRLSDNERQKVIKWTRDAKVKMQAKEAELEKLHTEVKNLQAMNDKKHAKGLGNMGIMIMPDHENLVDHIEVFTLDRDPISKTAVAVFEEKNPIKKIFHLKRKRIESVFSDLLALPTAFGWLGFFDARTYAQVTISNDEKLRKLVSTYNNELKHVTQDIFVMNRTAEELEQKKEGWWDKYGMQVMSTVAIILTAISIMYFASQMGAIAPGIAKAIQEGVQQGINATQHGITGTTGVIPVK